MIIIVTSVYILKNNFLSLRDMTFGIENMKSYGLQSCKNVYLLVLNLNLSITFSDVFNRKCYDIASFKQNSR